MPKVDVTGHKSCVSVQFIYFGVQRICEFEFLQLSFEGLCDYNESRRKQHTEKGK